MKKTKITLPELPKREKRIKTVELTNLFGGCVMQGNKCYHASDCCSNMCHQQICIA